MNAKQLQIIGVAISAPLMMFAVHENLWAEPLPETETEVIVEPAFTVEIEKEKTVIYEDMDLLASVVEAEAGNQSELGKRLVVDVIINRVNDPRFPDTLREVMLQPYQFSVVNNGAIHNVTPTQETWKAINLEWERQISKEVLYFQAGSYPEYGIPYEHVGDHYFSK